jgi:hypothetical protein
MSHLLPYHLVCLHLLHGLTVATGDHCCCCCLRCPNHWRCCYCSCCGLLEVPVVVGQAACNM